MPDAAPARMTSDEFIAWAIEQPKGCRYELVAGEVVATAPERSAHALTRFHVARRLAEAVERDGLSAGVDGDRPVPGRELRDRTRIVHVGCRT